MLPRRSHFPLWLEVIVIILGRSLYRVRSRGAEHVPKQGGALVIANHLSYADVVAFQLACPRPLRYLGYEEAGSPWYFKVIFRLAGVIPISSRRPTAGLRRAIKALEAGELVCLFPEGHISRTGQLLRIQKGFEVLARRAVVPVVPAAIDGLWGSIFSFANGGYLWKSPRLLPTPGLRRALGAAGAGSGASGGGSPGVAGLGGGGFRGKTAAAAPPGARGRAGAGEAAGARSALVDRTAERREVTAAQLLAASAAVLARRIRATVPENRVGIVLPPGRGRGAIANLAVVCAGKVPVNFNFTAGRASLGASLRLAGVGTVLTARRDARQGAPISPGRSAPLTCGRSWRRRAASPGCCPGSPRRGLLPNQWVAGLMGLPRTGDRAEAALLFTSGSGGEPKGVVLTHRNILANCSQVSSLSILPRTCTMAGCLPLFHGFGFTVNLWYPLLRGARVVTVPSPLDTRRLIDAIQQDKITTLVGAPTFLRPLLKKARPEELSSLQLVVSGAEQLPEDLRRGFREAFRLEILEGYGLTETSPVSSVNQFDPPVSRPPPPRPKRGQRAGSVGRLLPGMTARITDPETGAERALAETGLVWLRGANVFPGYLDDAERTRAAPAGRLVRDRRPRPF